MQTVADKPGTTSLMTTDEFLKALSGKVGRNTLFAKLKDKEIKHVRLGRKILILSSEVQDWPRRAAEATQ